MKKQNGFTLVELMVVVAILGLLSSIAAQSYQNYTLKAKLVEGVLLLNRLKTDVIISHQTSGKLPDYVMGAQSNVSVRTDDSDLIRDFRYKNTSNNKLTRGWIRVRFDDSYFPGCTKNKCAIYTGFIERNGSLTFYCGLWNKNWSDFPVDLMPQNCRETNVANSYKK